MEWSEKHKPVREIQESAKISGIWTEKAGTSDSCVLLPVLKVQRQYLMLLCIDLGMKILHFNQIYAFL